jgi:hypothetical protein
MARTVRRIGLGLLIFAGLVLFILWRSDNPRLGRARMAVVEALAPPGRAGRRTGSRRRGAR